MERQSGKREGATEGGRAGRAGRRCSQELDTADSARSPQEEVVAKRSTRASSPLVPALQPAMTIPCRYVEPLVHLQICGVARRTVSLVLALFGVLCV